MTDKVGTTFMLVLILSVFLVQQGTTMYWLGFHTQDLGWNLNTVNKEFNVTWVDLGINTATGEVVVSTKDELILRGSLMMYRGMEIQIVGFCFFFLSLGALIRGKEVYNLKHPEPPLPPHRRKKKSFWSRFILKKR